MGTNEGQTNLARGSPGRERRRESEEQMLGMFNEAWESLSASEQAELRREREDWLAARAQHGG